MPMQLMQVEELPRNTRMTLVGGQFLNEYGGRLKAGTVVMVDQPTARNWEVKGIAVPSAITDKTLKEQKIAQLQAIQDEIQQLDQPPVLTGPLYRGIDQSVTAIPRAIPTLTRAKAPRRQTKPRTARAVTPPPADAGED